MLHRRGGRIMMMLYKCKWCGQLFLKKHNKEQYCSKRCRHESQLESKRKYQNEYNRRNKTYNTRNYNLTRLGSKGTSSRTKPKKNFDDELRSIKQEKRLLGLS